MGAIELCANASGDSDLQRDRLALLRGQMAARGVAACVIPRADEYLGEYLPEHNERLHWLTGFTGSAGMAVVLRDSAAMFVDGRYTVQVRSQVHADHYHYQHLIETPPLQWLAGQLPAGARVLVDPRMHSLSWYRGCEEILGAAGIEICPTTDNPVDACWEGRPEPLRRAALCLEERFSGESSASKRARIGAQVERLGADAALIFAPDSVSWLLNVRGRDIPGLPILQSFAILEATGDLHLVVDPLRVPEGFAAHVGDGVTVVEEARAEALLAGWQGRKVLADPDTANAWTQLVLLEGGAELIAGQDPVLLPKACKNTVEISGARSAHERDGVAETRFLAWLDREVAGGRLHDEATLAERLGAFRAETALFHEPSFDTISAAGPNGAMCHYNHLNGQPAPLTMNSLYLVDSGGQYSDGTTDITRTVAIGEPTAEMRELFTLVLKGHIALATAVFPPGTTGTHLDALARQFLWRRGLDYDHGTGHGVGAFLSVHEGPQRIAKAWNATALAPGMIVSNEPGYYRDGDFGIRCENLCVVCEWRDEGRPGAQPMLAFETITLAPFDRRLVDTSLLDAQELDWLNAYHRRVYETLSPALADEEWQWLEAATAVLV
jgi:Xaa-Pro aminopeptidase